MEYLHDLNLIHRDLKTPNVLVGADEHTLKISDFGTSRHVGTKSTAMSFCGSVAWMAPEMVRSEPCGQMVDVWSFGVVLWELLTGQQPYSGVDTAAILYGIGTGGFHLPVASTTPQGFSLLLKQCWNKEPRHRPKFRQILLHLQIVEDDSGFLETPKEVFFDQQLSWKRENDGEFSKMKLDAEMADPDSEAQLQKRRENELKHAEDIRRLYEERLLAASQLLVDLRTKMRDMSGKEATHRHHRNGKPRFVQGTVLSPPLTRSPSLSPFTLMQPTLPGDDAPRGVRGAMLVFCETDAHL
jgi:serine/threonine protein kinase